MPVFFFVYSSLGIHYPLSLRRVSQKPPLPYEGEGWGEGINS